ncbi:MAG: sodium-extruding oxaloacetate decarboxylase subunit alpha [Porticoccus sp.]|nr:sodium-extruding oxaloacetate decarboxylase subunit alpha [Porticoccus sp.]
MTDLNTPLGITEVVLRDAHQSLFATRMRIDDMLPIAEKLDQVGYWSIESWGGATFDACIRFLGEDPWDRIRQLKKVMPNTPQQMLIRGQNILGYRHYADDVVEKFVERAAINGVDVFRVFDAMNDQRNLETALKAVTRQGKHAQGAMSYTVSPVHTIDHWVDMGRAIEDMGADSICIKDMAGLLKPYVGFHLVSKLKEACDIPIHLHSHATTGLSTATIMKCVEAGVDNVDTAISSMAMTSGHSATESVVAIFEETRRDTGLDILLLEEIAAHFREVRKKYTHFEGSLRGVDSRILVAQVPGGMLTNMESQLAEQDATNKLDDVLKEISRVREDLGFIPLVTPTSQIVGSQAVLNVLTGERYKSVSKETKGVMRGEYGITPAPVNAELQEKILEGEAPITCRPADLLVPELENFISELDDLAREQDIELFGGDQKIDDVLIYALFPQTGLKFLKNRGHQEAFEQAPDADQSVTAMSAEESIYTVTVEGVCYTVVVADGGDITGIVPIDELMMPVDHSSDEHIDIHHTSTRPSTVESDSINAPLGGNIIKVLVEPGQQVALGEQVVVFEAMKMETAVCSPRAGVVDRIFAKEGETVSVGDCLLTIN